MRWLRYGLRATGRTGETLLLKPEAWSLEPIDSRERADSVSEGRGQVAESSTPAHGTGRVPVRVGAVGYLNARPLTWALDRQPDRWRVRYDVPSVCAGLLHAGEVDLGL